MKPVHYVGLIAEWCVGIAAIVIVMKSSLSDEYKVLIMAGVALLALVISLLAPIGRKKA